MRLNLTWWPLAVIAVLAAVSAPASAQTTGLLRGRIVDPMRAAVADAHVAIEDSSSHPIATTRSDGAGTFVVSLAPAIYRVTASSAGFADTTRTVTVVDGTPVSVEIVLELAGYAQTVAVDGHAAGASSFNAGTRTATPLLDTPQSISVVTGDLIRDQLMSSVADVVNYVPGVTSHQGENNRDQVIIRGNSSSADFYVDGVRDDVQYYRDLYNVARVEALKGANGMIFGRGGGGGVINRISKQAGFMRQSEATLQAGSFGNRRLSADINQPLTTTAAFRINGVFEDSDSFRDSVTLQRYGIAPTVTLVAGPDTVVTVDYEHFHDERTADRGIPSFRGLPLGGARATFFGNPRNSRVRADVDRAGAMVEHHVGRFTIRNRTLIGYYDRGYQNYVPGAVSGDGALVSISAYNNATARLNTFNQTDVTRVFNTGRARHTLLLGGEAGRQQSDNFRNTGFFGNTATSISVPLADPTTIDTAVTFRQSATDADNRVRTIVTALYAQDQAELSSHVQVIGGMRVDRFDLRYQNDRNGETLSRVDRLVSPRAGVVLKPAATASIYASYSLSYLPSSGDQFASLTTITQQMKPERFANVEIGMKWDATPRLSLTTAAYQLGRTNTRATDPVDVTRIIQTGSQRTTGYELGISGHVREGWAVAGGYARQYARVVNATTSARAGARVAQVPDHTFSLWNSYQVTRRFGAALGVIYRSDMFAAVDNSVVLPGYTRADAAMYFGLHDNARLQVNVENLFDRRYFANADNNTNISPGAPRTLRVALSAGF